MEIIKDAIFDSVSSGFLSLQVPDVYIRLQGPEPECEDLPDDWFYRDRNGIPAVGRQDGFLYLSQKGYEKNKEELKKRFVNKRRHTWEDYENYVKNHFFSMSEKIDKKIRQLKKQIKELEQVIVT